jgi:hypothetical protein
LKPPAAVSPRRRLLRALLLAAAFAAGGLSSARAAEALQEIIVKDGDTLWGIANYYLKDPKRWPEILKYNPTLTDNPTVALPGMRLKVPVLLIKERLRAAELVYLLNQVRYRRNDSNIWKDAAPRMELFTDDGVRTLDQSAARIKFPAGDVVSLSENSLVILKPEKGEESVTLLSGDVRSNRSRVITGSGARVDPTGPDADFRTRVKSDKTELVLVYRGRVDVTSQGKTVRVPEGFGSEIKPLMPPTEPVPLPQIPLVLEKGSPAVDRPEVAVKALDDSGGFVLAVEVPRLEVSAPSGRAVGRPGSGGSPSGSSQARSVSRDRILEKFHLQVDDDEKFADPLIDRHLPMSERPDLMKFGLPDGTYWWRLAFVDTLGMEGPYSSPQSFTVDLKAPEVVVISPSDGQEITADEEFLSVSGETEPRSLVKVDGKTVSIDETGRFQTEIYLREGKSRIQIVVQDPNGNEARLERIVYRLLPGQKSKFAYARRTSTADEDERPHKQSGLAAFAVGLLSIGTIVGIVLLIVG